MGRSNKWIALILVFSLLLVLSSGCKKKTQDPIDEVPVIEEPKEDEIQEVEEPKEDEVVPEKTPIGIYPGNIAIPFELKNEKEQIIKSSKFKGKPVILVFWVTWSQEAMNQIDILNQLKQQYKNDVEIVGIHSSGFDILSYQETVNYLKGRNDAIEMLIDEKSEVNSAYYIGNYPTTYFIDSEGEIVKSVTNFMSKEQIAEVVKTLFSR